MLLTSLGARGVLVGALCGVHEATTAATDPGLSSYMTPINMSAVFNGPRPRKTWCMIDTHV